MINQMKYVLLLFFVLCAGIKVGNTCSILYYIDKQTGKIYAVNNEDFWYTTKPYIKILPAKNDELARLWFGWKDFAQGGINEAGLFFDGAVTPNQPMPEGYTNKRGNLGDEILAKCKNVNEAIDFLEKHKIALSNAHLLFGDKTGNAAVVSWVEGKRKITRPDDNFLIATNFLLEAPEKGNTPCYRYEAMVKEIQRLEESDVPIGLREVGNIAAKAVQAPRNIDGKTLGTLYTTFINITDMEFVLAFKLDNSKLTKLDLEAEFAKGKKRIIRLK